MWYWQLNWRLRMSSTPQPSAERHPSPSIDNYGDHPMTIASHDRWDQDPIDIERIADVPPAHIPASGTKAPTTVARVFFALVVVLVGGLGTVSPVLAQSTADVIEITGRGWGHGRGLGQYGAYGYAQQGWSSGQILDHYYGGTTAGSVPSSAPVDPDQVRVDLRYMRGHSTAVGLRDGNILLRGTDGADLGRFGDGAVRLQWVGSGYEVQTATSCSGSWATVGAIDGRSEVRLVAESSSANSTGLLHACGPGYRTWYRGELRAVVVNGYPLTINVVSIADYLRGVVPNEMPASWPAPALEAQAVSARSYALAGDTRQLPYADTCDTIRCQVYDGAFTERGGIFRPATHPRTDDAITATAGLVRIRNGAVARTEFSSSTGGHTAGGDFPAVVDEGDAISVNPNHTWTATIPVSKIEGRYNRGRLLDMEVVERNGHGADGGRVVRVEFRFEGGTVSESGNTVRSFLGLKSDWFTPGEVGGVDRRTTAEGAYIDRTFQALGGRSATDAEISRWYDEVARGDRRAMTDSLVVGDYFVGELVDDLYETALGRSADPSGRAYWVDRVQDGVKLGAVGVQFYGSQEYYQRAGGSDATFVAALYRDILGRAPDAGGQQYWEARLADGSARLDDVAAGFYSSLESRRARATALHLRLLGPIPSAEVRDALAGRLTTMDDLGLAAEIAASQEAYDA